LKHPSQPNQRRFLIARKKITNLEFKGKKGTQEEQKGNDGKRREKKVKGKNEKQIIKEVYYVEILKILF